MTALEARQLTNDKLAEYYNNTIVPLITEATSLGLHEIVWDWDLLPSYIDPTVDDLPECFESSFFIYMKNLGFYIIETNPCIISW